MTTLREAAQQALEALEKLYLPGELERVNAAITALRAALEQPDRAQRMREAGYIRRPTLREMAEEEQPKQAEPVAWMMVNKTHNVGPLLYWKPQTDWHITWEAVPLYTHPPRCEWRGLTDEEKRECAQAMDAEPLAEGWPELVKFARAIESKLKERNA
jgi:hypothetical protein